MKPDAGLVEALLPPSAEAAYAPPRPADTLLSDCLSGATRAAAAPKPSTPTSRPSSAKKIPPPAVAGAMAAPAKGERELEAQVVQLNEQVGVPFCQQDTWNNPYCRQDAIFLVRALFA